jgi:hypothetical protein
MVEIQNSGVDKLPKSLIGTAVERAAYDTTGIPAGSDWTETLNGVVTGFYLWDGTEWNEL